MTPVVATPVHLVSIIFKNKKVTYIVVCIEVLVSLRVESLLNPFNSTSNWVPTVLYV